MIDEFAIEPAVLDCWSRYEYFMADCGVEKGRLVADFPKSHWKKRVWQAVSKNPTRTPKDEQKVLHHLQHTAETKLVYLPRAYRFNAPEQPWLEQAVREHGVKPFKAIIAATKADGAPHILPVDDFDKDLQPLWRVSSSRAIPRDPEAIADLVGVLCAGARLVRLLDPHFDSGHQRFKKSFSRLFEGICKVADSKGRIEVHTSCKQSQEDFTDKLKSDWPRLIPQGRRISFHRWMEADEGEQLHRRLILSDRGGILVEAGLDVGREGQTTTVALLSAAEHSRFWNGLMTPGAASTSQESLYEFMDSYEVIGSAHSNRYGQKPK